MKQIIALLWAGILCSMPWSSTQAQEAPKVNTDCTSCHGITGNSAVPTFPKIAGQTPEYITKQLKNFQSKNGKPAERTNAIMNGVADALDDNQIRTWATVFSGQKTEVAASTASPAEWALGRRLYLGGNRATNIPACAGCHGHSGAGLPAQFPRIGGQHAAYTEAQLTSFKEGDRSNDPEAMMRHIAIRMTTAEIKAVSAYIASLNPSTTTK